jgi:hypothetical protein
MKIEKTIGWKLLTLPPCKGYTKDEWDRTSEGFLPCCDSTGANRHIFLYLFLVTLALQHANCTIAKEEERNFIVNKQ